MLLELFELGSDRECGRLHPSILGGGRTWLGGWETLEPRFPPIVTFLT